MINQNSWIHYFDPNDMQWKEPDVVLRARASSCSCSPKKLWWGVAGGGRIDQIALGTIGCRYFLVSYILHRFVVTLLLLLNDVFCLASVGTRIR